MKNKYFVKFLQKIYQYLCCMVPYYIFNMCYPKGCNNFYTFIEARILNIQVKNVPLTVGGLITRLNALKLE